MFLNICIYAKYKVYILEKFEMKLDILDKQEKKSTFLHFKKEGSFTM